LTSSSLHQQVRRTIRRHALCPPGARLLVGLSGGSDSVALTHLLRELAEHGAYTLVTLAHLNHRLRPSAARDEAFCRQFAERLGLRIVVEAADVQSFAQENRLSLEDAARRVRYDFLEGVAAREGATRIAVGHTQDDQAETLLLKLMRGAGLTGLAGIHPRRGTVIRPLLDVTRGELRAYLRVRGEGWVEDETNEDLDNPRNRIRHRILPELDLAAGGTTRPALARAAALIREDGQWLDELADERYRTLALETDAGVELDVAALTGTPSPLRSRVLLRAMRRAGGREIGLEHVEAVLGLLAGTQGGIDVPGSRAELRGATLVLVHQRRT
jgi:tRNA(Ile)-lysidine synthase